MSQPNYQNILKIGIRNSTYRVRPPRRSINTVRIIWAVAVVASVAIYAVGYITEWKF